MSVAAKIGIAIGILAMGAAFTGVCAMGYILYNGPRMKVQTNVRAFQAQVPKMPEGVVPVETRAALPSEAEAKTLKNPLEPTADAVARGKVYYEYYCIFCHGEKGDGNGPVGQSYVPKPSDLSDPKIQAYSDGDMLVKMLIGVGHEPVLERVVLPEHRWPLVLYMRQFAPKQP